MYDYQPAFRWMLPVYALTSGIVIFIPTITTKVVIDQITSHAATSQLIKTVLIMTAVMLFLDLMNAVIENQQWWRFVDCRLKFVLRRIRKTLFLDFEYLESPKIMDISKKAENSTNSNMNGVEGMMRSASSASVIIVKLIAASAILSMLAPWVVVMFFALGMINFIVLDQTKKKDKEKSYDPLAPYWRKSYYMQNMASNFSYAKDIRLFSMEGWLTKKHEDIHGFMHQKVVESKNRWIRAGMINHVLELTEQIAVYAYLVYCVIYKGMSIADFTLYLGTCVTFFAALGNVFQTVTDLRQQSREVNDFRTYIEYPNRIDSHKGIEIPKADQYEFVFDHVHFHYPDQEKEALTDLCLTLRPGERLAVVGLNGAGKSTFIKLLSGLYQPTKGRILMNGIDVRKFDTREYFLLFAPVFQNIELFAFPMDENVSMKTGDETDSELARQCLYDSGLKEKIEGLEHGVKTELLKVLHTDGIDLSGGEKQKLAFARALYKNAPIVILDEPTSALDALAEYRLYQEFDHMIGKKSAVYISHRLSSTRFCDHVAMFESGQMTEYGTHEELLEKKGSYAAMFEVQAQYYKKEKGGVSFE